jgi:transposase-like protein
LAHFTIFKKAGDGEGNTVDYLPTAKRDRKSAKRFLCRAIKSNIEPIKTNIDKSGANTAAINDYNDEEAIDIEIRQNKYLNNLIEQDHRPTKQLYRATLGWKVKLLQKFSILGLHDNLRIQAFPRLEFAAATDPFYLRT